MLRVPCPLWLKGRLCGCRMPLQPFPLHVLFDMYRATERSPQLKPVIVFCLKINSCFMPSSIAKAPATLSGPPDADASTLREFILSFRLISKSRAEERTGIKIIAMTIIRKIFFIEPTLLFHVKMQGLSQRQGKAGWTKRSILGDRFQICPQFESLD